LISIADEFSGKFFDKKKDIIDLGSVIAHLLQELNNEFLGKDVIDMNVSLVIGWHKASEGFVFVKISIRKEGFDKLDKASIRIRFVVHFEVLVLGHFLLLGFVLVFRGAETQEGNDLGLELHRLSSGCYNSGMDIWTIYNATKDSLW
jgi:hypothetical protein